MKEQYEKDYKGDFHNEDMGRGQGYLGLKKKYNPLIRLIFIWLSFGGLGIYLLKINQGWAGFISFACGLMFSAFNNLLKD